MLDSFSFLTHRQNKTSAQRRKLKQHITNNQNNHFFSEKRPSTTIYSRTQNIHGYRSIDNAEEELNQTIGDEKSSYIIRNVKELTKKFNKKFLLQSEQANNLTFISQDSTIKSQSQPRSLRQAKICQLSFPKPCKVEEVVCEPFFINARQKLQRMIARKKQQQIKYQNMQYKVRQIQKQRLIARRQKDRSFKNPEHVNNVQWDNQWRKQSIKQVSRYRTRLSVKHKRNSSNYTIQW